jgi:SAM-dependent methyltransferase
MIKRLKTSLKNKLRDKLVPTGFYFKQKGHCPCCEQDVIFETNNSWLRDHFLCPVCSSIPRERALTLVIEKYYPNWRDFTIHESSGIDRGASYKLRRNCKEFIASQYYPNQPLGTKLLYDYFNEDLEKQTFQDASFDLVITQDVMEHIYEPKKAFSEIARTLKPGGAHIFTVPLFNGHQKSEVWATKGEGGKPVFLKTPEYHGNPVDPEGSPVTMHWGFDIVDHIKSYCGLTSTIEYMHDLKYGIWAEFIEVVVTKK